MNPPRKEPGVSYAKFSPTSTKTNLPGEQQPPLLVNLDGFGARRYGQAPWLDVAVDRVGTCGAS